MSVPVNVWRDALDYKSEEWKVSANGYNVKGAITVEPILGKNIYWLYVLMRDNKIGRLEGFLQRPILERIWKEKGYRKCLEFLTSAFLGTSTLDGYIFVPAQLVKLEIEKYIQEEKDAFHIPNKPGYLTLFPDFIPHGVSINNYPEPRISIAGGIVLETWVSDKTQIMPKSNFIELGTPFGTE